jgi:caffeoyl-CoA O-methyltransferase
MPVESSLNNYLKLIHKDQPKEIQFFDFLDQARASAAQLGRPQMPIEFEDGLLLNQLVQTLNPERVLEIGVLSGYSSLWILKALQPGSNYLGLEKDPQCIALAEPLLKSYIEQAGLNVNLEMRVGPALDSLQADIGFFDFIFIDADKANYLNYFEKSWTKLNSKGLIIVDNAFLYGEVFSGEASRFSKRQIEVVKELHSQVFKLGGSVVNTSDGFLCVHKS